MRRRHRVLGPALALLAMLLAAAPAVADDTSIHVIIPATAGTSVTNAQLRWALDAEAGGGAFAGGCNFLSAGRAANAGGARAWTAADGLYAATAGHVRIEKPTADGGWALATWADRCLDPNGTEVTPASTDSTSGSQVVIDGGSGVVDRAAGTASLRWSGSFTVAFYGGMTYWSATDPQLVVAGDGTGLLTARASGYAADRADPTRWVPVAPRTVTLARLRGVTLGATGFTVAPDYLGVAVHVAVGTQQASRDETNAAWWGSFPQDFVDFQQLTGQGSYWYTSGGVRDPAKVAAPLTVSFDAEHATRPAVPPSGAGAAGSPDNPVRTAPAPAPVAEAPGAASPAAPGAATGLTVPGAPATVLAARPLTIQAAGRGRGTDRERLLAAGSVLAVLAALAGLGLARGWLVVPGSRGAGTDLRKVGRKA